MWKLPRASIVEMMGLEPSQNDVETVCRAIYESTRRLHEELEPQLGPMNCGFKILYGPPVSEPPVMFIGYQPGGDEKHIVESDHQSWPTVCEYAVARWPLAKALRVIFGPEVLKVCTGVNAVFFRARSVRDYGKLDRKLRGHIERFCLGRVRDLVATLRPKQIVFIGFEAMRLFDAGRAALVNAKGRVLTISGSAAGCPALAMVHVTGCRISADDRKKIATRLAGLVQI